MIWRKRKGLEPALDEPLLRFAKQARDEAARLPQGEARSQLLRTAEASELAVIEGWLSPLTPQ